MVFIVKFVLLHEKVQRKVKIIWLSDYLLGDELWDSNSTIADTISTQLKMVFSLEFESKPLIHRHHYSRTHLIP